MPKYIDLDTLRYILYQVHDLESLLEKEHFAEHDRENIDMLFQSIKDMSDQDFYPVFREMDENPAHYKEGKIITHPVLKKVMQQGGAMGMIGGTFDFEDGGLQLPLTVWQAAACIVAAANNHVGGYLGLTRGAAELIIEFGSQTLKDTFVPDMLSGNYGGTMCLTEPQAGSSLSDIITTAYPQEDGTYKIKGQKIFISGGDHEYAENFVHLLLARIDGAPAGTKGISLFVVPKLRTNDAGELVSNDVQTAGDYQKMGQRGYCTTHLVFGENDDCIGHLVGKPHNGLRYMFLMMNGARIAVGGDATAITIAAFHASLQYAMERPQGRRLSNEGKKDLSKDQSLIIEHADVRRMLMLQRAVAEGSLALVMQGAMYHDLEKTSTGDKKERYKLLLEIMTPIVKTYPSEMGRVAVDNGLQVLGGYGFCSEYILQQYLRDIRIMAIYEGTTGIQSQDLLGRKVTMKDGKALYYLSEEMMETIETARTFDDLIPMAMVLSQKIELTQKVVGHLMQYAAKGHYERFLADATIFMQLFSTIVVGWQWLKIGVAARKALVIQDQKQHDDFYKGKLQTMRYFYKYEMPKVDSRATILINPETITIADRPELIGV